LLALCALENSEHDSAMLPVLQPASDWKPLYEAALLEKDATKLPERISAARNAILDRIEESLWNPSPAEHHVMDNALRNLHRLAEAVTAKAAA
jgi:hypothetical protein